MKFLSIASLRKLIKKFNLIKSVLNLIIKKLNLKKYIV